jgi:hypothetical protein
LSTRALTSLSFSLLAVVCRVTSSRRAWRSATSERFTTSPEPIFWSIAVTLPWRSACALFDASILRWTSAMSCRIWLMSSGMTHAWDAAAAARRTSARTFVTA